MNYKLTFGSLNPGDKMECVGNYHSLSSATKRYSEKTGLKIKAIKDGDKVIIYRAK